jgi:hypothetical protein
MKARLTFNLEDPEDAMAHLRCVKATDMALAMWTFTSKLRKLVDESEDGKYLDEEYVWGAWEAALNEHDINIDNLIN